MNRSQLVEELAGITGLTKRQAEDAVEAFVDIIRDQIRSKNKVTLYAFGSFSPTARNARMGRNPRTGQPVKIAASSGIRFSPAAGFKADLNAKKAPAKKLAKAGGRASKAAPAAKATKAAKAPAKVAAKVTGKKAAAAVAPVAKRPVGRPPKAASAPVKAAAKKVTAKAAPVAKKAPAKKAPVIKKAAPAAKVTKAAKSAKAPAKATRAGKR